MQRILTAILFLTATAPATVFAQPPTKMGARVESNVIYGMYSGLALLMDVHTPEKPNGYGIIFISGSAWHAPLSYEARLLKDDDRGGHAKALVEAGYSVFRINHRAAPRFRYPAAVEDAQRAVRYVRHHAKRFGIRPDRIGASGGSSGGHLVSLLGVLDGKGDPADADPVNRESAKVQCVVAHAAPSDLINVPTIRQAVGSFMGMLIERAPPTSVEYKTYREASPISHVSKDDAPFLLIHGDADEIVLFKHSEVMAEALKQAGVAVKLVRIEGGGHNANFRGPGFREEKGWPDYLGETVRWFDQHLRTK
ncbi:MAG: alpha/beta hydrolase [Acidobacteriota bacterium]